jgi:hypothetical protein
MATTVAAPPPPPAEPARMSAISRIFGVFFSPKQTFEDIARKPSWLAPFIVLTILSLIVSYCLNQKMNWRDYVGQQIEKSPRSANLTPEQKEQQAEMGARFSPAFTYAVGLLAPTIGMLVVTLVMWGGFNLLGGANATFSQAFGVTAHASLTGILNSILFLVVLFIKPPGTFDLENPVATNLGAFLSPDSAKWLLTLARSIDVFTIWTLILLAIGFAAINPRKLKGGKAFSIAFSIWVVYVIIRVGFSFVFS